ncbi:hypothetical protein K501DRAFT_275230 [Backusella circina FSU 941]|nr:hypothetical protein K501DRAFT_275230 [Backusella circina FSU 941]
MDQGIIHRCSYILSRDKRSESIHHSCTLDIQFTVMEMIGLEAHVMSINTADDHLYVANSIESYILPSTVSQLKTQCKSLIGRLFDFKHYTLNTANIIKQGLNDKKKRMKRMKRKMQEDINNEETSPPPKRQLTPIWRYKKNAKN